MRVRDSVIVLAAVAAAFVAGRYWFPSAASVTAYLEEHPEFLADRPELVELARPWVEARATERRRQTRRDLMATTWAGFLTADSTPRLGAATDPVAVVEFADFACIPCKAGAERLASLAASNPDTRIVKVYVPSGDEGAELAARVAIAVWQHSEADYPEVHADLMATPVARLDARARFWLDEPRFAGSDLWTAVGDESVLASLKRGRALFEALDIRVVPSFVINGELLAGPVPAAALQSAIDAARAATGSPAAAAVSGS